MIKKIGISLLLVLSLCFTGCNKEESNEGEGIFAIAQNDYAGGCQRATKIQTDVLAVMEEMNQNNVQIQQENPDSYWGKDNFYFLNFLPVYVEEMQLFSIINESDSWSDIVAYIQAKNEENGGKNISLEKLNVHEYKISQEGRFYCREKGATYSGTNETVIKYDASGNSFQVISNIIFPSNVAPDPQLNYLYEFAELETGVYVLQTNTERLYATYDKEGQLESFAYSDVNSIQREIEEEKSQKEPNKFIISIDFYDYYEVPKAVETPIYQTQYIEKDSVFTHLGDITKDWVKEFKVAVYNTSINYENKCATIELTNILTNDISQYKVYEPTQNEDGTFNYKPIELVSRQNQSVLELPGGTLLQDAFTLEEEKLVNLSVAWDVEIPFLQLIGEDGTRIDCIQRGTPVEGDKKQQIGVEFSQALDAGNWKLACNKGENIEIVIDYDIQPVPEEVPVVATAPVTVEFLGEMGIASFELPEGTDETTIVRYQAFYVMEGMEDVDVSPDIKLEEGDKFIFNGEESGLPEAGSFKIRIDATNEAGEVVLSLESDIYAW